MSTRLLFSNSSHSISPTLRLSLPTRLRIRLLSSRVRRILILATRYQRALLSLVHLLRRRLVRRQVLSSIVVSVELLFLAGSALNVVSRAEELEKLLVETGLKLTEIGVDFSNHAIHFT